MLRDLIPLSSKSTLPNLKFLKMILRASANVMSRGISYLILLFPAFNASGPTNFKLIFKSDHLQ